MADVEPMDLDDEQDSISEGEDGGREDIDGKNEMVFVDK